MSTETMTLNQVFRSTLQELKKVAPALAGALIATACYTLFTAAQPVPVAAGSVFDVVDMPELHYDGQQCLAVQP